MVHGSTGCIIQNIYLKNNGTTHFTSFMLVISPYRGTSHIVYSQDIGVERFQLLQRSNGRFTVRRVCTALKSM